MTFSPPPRWLEKNREALACYWAIQERLRMQGAWRGEYAFGVALIALQCAAYLSDARAIRAIEKAPADTLQELEKGLARICRMAWEG